MNLTKCILLDITTLCKNKQKIKLEIQDCDKALTENKEV